MASVARRSVLIVTSTGGFFRISSTRPYVFRLFRTEEEITIGVLGDLLDILARMEGEDLVQHLRLRRISFAWISMSLTCPPTPP